MKKIKLLILTIISIIVLLLVTGVCPTRSVERAEAFNRTKVVMTAKVIIPTEDFKKIDNALRQYADKIAEEKVSYEDGWVNTNNLNIRNLPSKSGKVIGHLSFNEKVKYTKSENAEWVRIKYGEEKAYVKKEYIANEKASYTIYDVPSNRGFKSYMDYRCITSTGSKQYKLQSLYGETGKYGIRTVNGRYCIAVGSHFTTSIGQYLDLILENGTVIPCVLGDQKADADTDANNIVTMHNGCVSEFVVNTDYLHQFARRDGNISSCTEEWGSPVTKIKVYNRNVFDK